MSINREHDEAGFSYERFQDIAPAALSALLAMGKAVDESGLEKELTELVKLHVSQLNHCAFCTQLHLNVARRVGADAPKLDLVAAWRDAGVYSGREMAALAWAEQVTAIADGSAPGTAYTELRDHFSETEVVHLTVAIANINAWKRIAGALHFAPPEPERGQHAHS